MLNPLGSFLGQLFRQLSTIKCENLNPAVVYHLLVVLGELLKIVQCKLSVTHFSSGFGPLIGQVRVSLGKIKM